MYSSVADVRMALTRDGDETNVETAADFEDSQLIDAIVEADGVIDVYVKTRFQIPVDPDADPPGSVAVQPIRGWSRDLAGWYATLTFRKSKDILDEDPVQRRFALVMQMLVGIADGSLTPSLPPAEPDPELSTQGVFVENLYEGTLFTPADFMLQRYTYIAPHRYGDLGGSLGLNEVLVLQSGDPLPSNIADNTLVVYV